MRGEKIDIEMLDQMLVDQCLNAIIPCIRSTLGHASTDSTTVTKMRCHIAIAGESGSGKTTLAYALAHALTKYPFIHNAGTDADSKTEYHKIDCLVLQIDDYFRLAPRANHDQRLTNLAHVGLGEVRLELIDDHLAQSWAGAEMIEKPLLSYDSDEVGGEQLSLKEIEVVFIEGTYVSVLNNLDYRIFLDRDYKQTRDLRLKRSRDHWSLESQEFDESVLSIEHAIISSHRSLADLVISPCINEPNKLIAYLGVGLPDPTIRLTR